jgi:Flp pilus assembly protein TadG
VSCLDPGVTVNPKVVTRGQTAQGTVTPEGPVSQDTIVGLAATETGGPFLRPGDSSSVAHTPSVTVHAGDTTATCAVETSAVAPHVSRTATILAHAVVAKSAKLTLEGA